MNKKLFIILGIFAIVGCAMNSKTAMRAIANYSDWDNYSMFKIQNSTGKTIKEIKTNNNTQDFSKSYRQIEHLLGFRDKRCISQLLNAQTQLKDRFRDVGTDYFQNHFQFIYNPRGNPKLKLSGMMAFPEISYTQEGESTGYYNDYIHVDLKYSYMDFNDRPCNPGDIKGQMEKLLSEKTDAWKEQVQGHRDSRSFRSDVKEFEDDVRSNH